MLRIFTVLPSIISYILAICVIGGTFYVKDMMLAADPETDVNRIWLVGGILAFLFAFGGFQRSIERRNEKVEPRVSSADVMQKLAPMQTGVADKSLEAAPMATQELDADSPLGRLRARSNPLESP